MLGGTKVARCLVVRTPNLRLSISGPKLRIPVMTLPGYFWDRWPFFAGKLSLDMNTTQRVAKSSTSFGWDKDGKVTAGWWQVTLCDPMWHVISRSDVVISITNCYILIYAFTFNNQLNSSKVWRQRQWNEPRVSVSVISDGELYVGPVSSIVTVQRTTAFRIEKSADLDTKKSDNITNWMSSLQIWKWLSFN